MEHLLKHMIIIASLLTAELSFTESKDNEGSYPLFSDICDHADRTSKMHCYCDKPKMATSADCWVFTRDIGENDPIWSSFSSQPLLERLMFDVRAEDALTMIPSQALSRLDHLRHLTIQFGTINVIPEYAFNNSTSLRQIELTFNKICILEVNSFSMLMLLRQISLENNQISELRRGVFYVLPNLRVLRLSNNKLALIQEGCFKYLINLLELKLDSNLISVVTREMFEGLENLVMLDLRYNKLTMLGNLAFSKMWGLKELELDYNDIEYISDRSFDGLRQMSKLSLSGNKLKVFYEVTLHDVRSLLILNLSHNLLETISYEASRNVLENDCSISSVINLEGNPLSCDCRLAWLYPVRNRTSEGALREALDNVTCIADSVLLDTLTHAHQTHKRSNTDQIYDYVDKSDAIYELKNLESNVKPLFSIPPEALPCTEEFKQTMESNQPIQNEIRLKAYSNSVKCVVDVKICVTVLLFMLV